MGGICSRPSGGQRARPETGMSVGITATGAQPSTSSEPTQFPADGKKRGLFAALGRQSGQARAERRAQKRQRGQRLVLVQALPDIAHAAEDASQLKGIDWQVAVRVDRRLGAQPAFACKKVQLDGSTIKGMDNETERRKAAHTVSSPVRQGPDLVIVVAEDIGPFESESAHFPPDTICVQTEAEYAAVHAFAQQRWQARHGGD